MIVRLAAYWVVSQSPNRSIAPKPASRVVVMEPQLFVMIWASSPVFGTPS